MNVFAFKLTLALLSVITFERNSMILSYQGTRTCTRFVQAFARGMTNDAANAAAKAKSSAIKVGKKIGVNSVSRHIFLCADQTKAKCCSMEAGMRATDLCLILSA
jgi:hypothetical protein